MSSTPTPSAITFVAQTSSGVRTDGTLEVETPAAAQSILQSLGLQVIDVSSTSKPKPRAVGTLDLAAFNAQLAHLLAAGVPLEQSLRLVAEESGKGHLAEGIRAVALELEKGLDLPSAIAKHSSAFPALYGKLVDAGIKSGNLPGVLASLSRHLNFDRQLRQMMWRAAVYPLIVLTGVGGVGLFFSCWVLPNFITIFSDFKVMMPTPTSFCLHYLAPISLIVFLLPSLFLLSIALLRAMGKTQWCIDALLLRMPFLGRIIGRSLSARFCDGAQLGLAAGMDLPSALRMASDATGSSRVSRDTAHLCECIEQGKTPSGEMKMDVLPPVIPLALGTASRGGLDAPTALARMAMALREQAEYRLIALQNWAVPTTVLVLGICVGLVALSLFMPMIAIMDSLSGGGKR